ncbi:MAG: efflux RND transporter periplasmic adaptor subunit [Gammaproteobacteria bacterium]|nr:MAG: efflux RND transporter periplasmic adaptor subunit [Gammaproteobacteria bacterium]
MQGRNKCRIILSMRKNYLCYWLMTGCCLLLLGSCSRSSSQEAQGYIEGRYTYMATSVSGVLKQLMVERGAKVKKGQMLFVLEPQPESDAYMAAVANLKQAIASRDATAASLEYAKLTFERYKVLVPQHAIQQSELDNARSNYFALQAQLIQANANITASQATLAQSKWTKDQKIVYAPLDAEVFDTYFRLGEYTEANQSILSLLAPADIKVIFYISEVDLGSIRLNDPVDVRCDNCTTSYTGHISFISPSAEYTPPIIYSTETNNKLIYRIEAEFAPKEAYQLHPGQPVYVTYHLHD